MLSWQRLGARQIHGLLLNVLSAALEPNPGGGGSVGGTGVGTRFLLQSTLQTFALCPLSTDLEPDPGGGIFMGGDDTGTRFLSGTDVRTYRHPPDPATFGCTAMAYPCPAPPGTTVRLFCRPPDPLVGALILGAACWMVAVRRVLVHSP